MYHVIDYICMQARPITTLDRETDDEIIHEFDSSLAMDREYLTTANIQLVTLSGILVDCVIKVVIECNVQNSRNLVLLLKTLSIEFFAAVLLCKFFNVEYTLPAAGIEMSPNYYPGTLLL